MRHFSPRPSSRKREPASRISASRLLPILGLASAVGLYCGVEPNPTVAPRLPTPPTVTTATTPATAPVPAATASVPTGLRLALLQTAEREAGPAYALAPATGRTQPTLVARSPQAGIWAELTAGGVQVGRLALADQREGQTPALTLALADYGCDGAEKEAKPVPPRIGSGRNRAEYARPGLTEWYVNSPLGLEQGFTVDKDPGCRGGARLVVGLQVRTPSPLALVGQGQATHLEIGDRKDGPPLRYGHLFVLDADGRELPSRMVLQSQHLRLEVDTAGARYPLHIDPLTYVEEAILAASNGAAGDELGVPASLSSDGSRALLGAYRATVAGKDDAGAAYVYSRNALGMWTEEAILVPSDPSISGIFGLDVALSGDGNRALIGSSGSDPAGMADAGQAYIFTRNAMGMWTEEKILTASNKATTDGFGRGVSLSSDGNRALVGAPNADPGGTADAGAAYVFNRDAMGMWTEEAILTASNKATGDIFGFSAALSSDGGRALIGASFADPGAISNAGAAYVYGRNAMGMWTEEAILAGSVKEADDNFGTAVALSGDGLRVLVGAPGANPGALSNAGRAFVFSRGGAGMWPEEAVLTASNKAAGDDYGYAVALSGDGSRAVVGAHTSDPGGISNAGTGYLYSRGGTGMWTEQALLTAATKVAETRLGRGASMSSDGKLILLGANGASPGGKTFAGGGYVFNEGRVLGQTCTDAAECRSGFCADGVCCNTACGGGSTTDCQACSKATGAVADGTCGAASTATVCRAQNGGCDVAEMCDGSTLACPADAKRPMGFECRMQNGVCDVAETCDGTSGACPADGFASASTQCRAAAGPCDVAENCMGTGPTCPGDAKRPSTTTCRSAAGACDVAEMCDGSNNACPANALRPRGFVCKPAGASATCDPADLCDGLRTSCPANFAPYGTACGTAMTCNGIGRCL